jgi:[ribosomal protein S18]-alanine N-acetyltransferase
VIIRPMAEADLPAVAAIQQACPSAAQWNPSDYLALDATVAELDGRVAGFLVVRAVAEDEREVLNVAVDPLAQRQGVAAQLLSEALRRGAVRWFLEVRESNRPARNLYKKWGFLDVGRRPSYYTAPEEDCIVMSLQS